MKYVFLVVEHDFLSDIVDVLDDYASLLEALEHDEEPTSFFEGIDLYAYRKGLDELREVWIEILRKQAIEEEMGEEKEEPEENLVTKSDLDRIRLELLEISERLKGLADELKGGG